MQGRKLSVWVAGVLAAGALLAGAEPSWAREAGGGPVLAGGTGGPYCGPCEPRPLVTRAAPGTAVVALRYRWSTEARSFDLVSEEKVGVTDEQGELQFTVPQGEGSLDKVVVSTGGAFSEPFLFVTVAGCAGPRLCPLPRRLHAFANASAYLPGQPAVVTVSGAEPGSALVIVQEEYAGDGEYWRPAGEPALVNVDALGHAVAVLKTAEPGAFRVVARDRETGEESDFGLFEVNAVR
jgi:hypothetical protein